MVKQTLVLLFFFFLSSARGEPRNIKVIFLSRADATSYIFEQIEKTLYPFWGNSLAQVDSKEEDYECIPYGEGCFHPQKGYIEDDSEVKKKSTKPIEGQPETKTFNDEATQLVDCDKDYYFDMFCGKAKNKEKNKVSTEEYQLWIDISSSMKQVDFSKDEEFCERRRIAARLEDSCGSKVDIFTFNTSRQRANGLESTCLNYGTNNSEKLADWLKKSEVKSVVIITDVDEYTGPFREYLDQVGAEIEGIGVKPIYATDLGNFFDPLKSLCR